MNRLVIFGNSGSGKSTLARTLSDTRGLAHLDLDTLAWEPQMPPTRRSIAESAADISIFMRANASWVIEGTYADLLRQAIPLSTELIYLDLPVDKCIENAKKRPWEPHKYPSKKAQDANLSMLIEWIAQYEVRKDTFSKSAHQALYDDFDGKKTRYVDSVDQLPTVK